MTRDELLAQASEPDDFGDDLELVTLPVPVNGKPLRVVVRALSREERLACARCVLGFAGNDEQATPSPEVISLMIGAGRETARLAMVKPEFSDALWDSMHDENQAAITESANRLGSKKASAGVDALAKFPGGTGGGAAVGQ